VWRVVRHVEIWSKNRCLRKWEGKAHRVVRQGLWKFEKLSCSL
jgi:hypothetical protein